MALMAARKSTDCRVTFQKWPGSTACRRPPIADEYCGTCGAALYSCKGETPAFLFLRTGVIRQRAQLIPTAQGFCDVAQPWAMEMARIAIVPAGPGKAPRP